MKNFEDKKTVIITGATKGIGRSISLAFAQKGYNLMLNYSSDEEAAAELLEVLKRDYDVSVKMIKGDVSKEETAVEMFEETIKHFGLPDVLVNNAGISPPNLIEDMTLSEWERVFDVNLTSCFLFSREMIRATKEKKNSCIINFTSQVAYNGSFTGKSHYAATKGGIVSFTVSLAKEVSKYGIRVVAVAPGMVYTEGTKELLKKREDEYNNKLPIGRIADAKEIADVVLYLSSDAASYITGTTIDVSGGMIGI